MPTMHAVHIFEFWGLSAGHRSRCIRYRTQTQFREQRLSQTERILRSSYTSPEDVPPAAVALHVWIFPSKKLVLLRNR